MKYLLITTLLVILTFWSGGSLYSQDSTQIDRIRVVYQMLKAKSDSIKTYKAITLVQNQKIDNLQTELRLRDDQVELCLDTVKLENRRKRRAVIKSGGIGIGIGLIIGLVIR